MPEIDWALQINISCFFYKISSWLASNILKYVFVVVLFLKTLSYQVLSVLIRRTFYYMNLGNISLLSVFAVNDLEETVKVEENKYFC